MIATNFDEVVAQMRKFLSQREKELKQAAELTPRQVGALIKREVIASIKREQAVASGDLMKSVSVTGLRASTQMSEATVGSSSPYAKFVEEGVRAGAKRPTTAVIYKWMIQKGLQPSETGAFLIAKAIERRGLPARRPFEKGVDIAEGKIDHEINIVLNKTLKN